MAKIYYNEKALRKIINQNLDTSIAELRRLVNSMEELILPEDFQYKTYIRKVQDSINSNSQSLMGVMEKLQKSTALFSQVENNLRDKLKSIENYSMKMRESSIK